MANAAQREILSSVGQPDLSVDDVSDIQAVIVECGALAGMETLIDELRDVAIAAIKTLIPAGEARDALTSLAVYVTERAA
jgi:geranylgeranyl pyrophosphate synthase